MRIRDIALKTGQKRRIGRSDGRGSGISVVVARHDDDDERQKEKLMVWVENNILDLKNIKKKRENFKPAMKK